MRWFRCSCTKTEFVPHFNMSALCIIHNIPIFDDDGLVREFGGESVMVWAGINSVLRCNDLHVFARG